MRGGGRCESRRRSWSGPAVVFSQEIRDQENDEVTPPPSGEDLRPSGSNGDGTQACPRRRSTKARRRAVEGLGTAVDSVVGARGRSGRAPPLSPEPSELRTWRATPEKGGKKTTLPAMVGIQLAVKMNTLTRGPGLPVSRAIGS
jgi:hypothetical protein